jgi:hypothetical protein
MCTEAVFPVVDCGWGLVVVAVVECTGALVALAEEAEEAEEAEDEEAEDAEEDVAPLVDPF